MRECLDVLMLDDYVNHRSYAYCGKDQPPTI